MTETQIIQILEDFKSQVVELKRRKNKTIKNLETENSELMKEVDSISTNYSDLIESFGKLEDLSIESLDKKLSRLEGVIGDKTQTGKDLTEKLIHFKTDNEASTESDIEELEIRVQKIHILRETLLNHYKLIKNQRDNLVKLDQLNKQVESLSEFKATELLEKNNSDLKDTINKQVLELKQKGDKLSQLEKENSEFKKEIETLKEKKTQLEKQVQDLTKENNEMKNPVSKEKKRREIQHQLDQAINLVQTSAEVTSGFELSESIPPKSEIKTFPNLEDDQVKTYRFGRTNLKTVQKMRILVDFIYSVVGEDNEFSREDLTKLDLNQKAVDMLFQRLLNLSYDGIRLIDYNSSRDTYTLNYSYGVLTKYLFEEI